MSSATLFKNVLLKEARAIERTASFVQDVEVNGMMTIFELLRASGGNLITTGVGKSGIIAKKISSTMSSLGLPSFYLHPTEALHGDLGKVGVKDAFILISKSGTTEEIIKLLPYLPLKKEMIIGLLGNVESSLASKCGVVFNCSVSEEACLNNQAPTTSTTVALAVGDALAVLFEDMIGLSKEGFAQYHPGGLLGKSLSLKVSDLMIKKGDCAHVGPKETMEDVILSMTKYPSGMCAVVDDKILRGIIVEGDIRRTLSSKATGLKTLANEMMNQNPLSISSYKLAYEALEMMEKREKPVTVLPVIDGNEFLGVIRIHDLLREGFSKK
ncbi:MAG: KpsF/GutQ family sugar-phosphate isomerase [Bacteriovoracaceae bacterium]